MKMPSYIMLAVVSPLWAAGFVLGVAYGALRAGWHGAENLYLAIYTALST